MPPGEVLKLFLTAFIDKNDINERLKDEIPKKWEKYGDFVLFDERTLCSEIWKSQNINFWENIANILQCKRIALKNKIQKDGFRSPNVTMVLGEDPWIVCKDNAITYTWNVQKNMFSAGNANERHRIAKLNCQNEIVVDLFAGIGYFTLPFIIHANAAMVHACEWNPWAIEALKLNLKLNKIQDKCKIYEGNNILMCPKKIGNRVNLGLIPSSEKYWEVACEALVEEGGMLHVHENVESKKLEKICNDCHFLYSQINWQHDNKNLFMKSNENFLNWGEQEISWKHKQWLIKGIHILHSLKMILAKMNSLKVWYCIIEHVNFVKSYAPNVQHLVFDIRVLNEKSG